MSDLSREERKELSKKQRQHIKNVEQMSEYRRAQNQLREYGIDFTSAKNRHNIIKALDQELSDIERKQYNSLKSNVKKMNYAGSALGLVSAAILPRIFRSYHQRHLLTRIGICVGLFVVVHKATIHQSMNEVEEFQIDFIEKHRDKFLETSYES